MSKFCGNCGAQLDDSAKVCGYCGTMLDNGPTGNISAPNPIPGIKTESDQKKAEQTKKFIKLGAIAVVAVVVLSILISMISSFTGYKGTVRKVIKAFENYDTETLYSYASKLSYFSEDIDDCEDAFEYRISDKLDSYEKSAGHDIKISYEIVDAYDLDDRKMNRLLENLEDRYDIDTSDINTIKVVELSLKIKGSKRSTTDSTDDDLMLVKENGKWKVYYTGY